MRWDNGSLLPILETDLVTVSDLCVACGGMAGVVAAKLKAKADRAKLEADEAKVASSSQHDTDMQEPTPQVNNKS
jgi:hypothetical protein